MDDTQLGTPTDLTSIVESVVGDSTHSNSSVIFMSDKHSINMIVPEFEIPQDGMLTRWLFATQLSLLPYKNTPQLQVWRKVEWDNLERFRLVDSTEFQLLPSRSTMLGTYEYVLDSPIPVQAGDILGVYQPAEDEALFRMAMLPERGPFIYQLARLEDSDTSSGRIWHPTTRQRAFLLMSAEIQSSKTQK